MRSKGFDSCLAACPAKGQIHRCGRLTASTRSCIHRNRSRDSSTFLLLWARARHRASGDTMRAQTQIALAPTFCVPRANALGF